MANNDFHDGIDVCVGNWGYYSEGELRDTWMHLPMNPDEIEPWLRGHGLVDEEHEETYISPKGTWRISRPPSITASR